MLQKIIIECQQE